MQRELEKMRVEAQAMTKEIKQVLDDQKEIWKQETAALKDSLVEARAEMDSAKVDSDAVLQSSRSAFKVFQQEKIVTMADSQAKSNAAMLEASNTFEISQQDYKQDSKIIAQNLKAGIKETRDSMKRMQKGQKRDSKNSRRDVLAALNKAKNKRLAELKRGSVRKKLSKKKALRPKRKRIQKPKPEVVDRKTIKIKEIEKKPKQEKAVEDEAELVVASLPDAPVKSSEESPQAKLSRFSKNISSLKNNLKNTNGNPEALLAKLGDAYLEAQRFMNSQTDTEERQNLLDLSDNGDLLLGSYEQAAWAYKLALTFNRKNAETHLKIGKIYDEMEDGRNALMYTKLAHQIFKRNHNSRQMEATQSFIDLLTTKYENKSGKKGCMTDNVLSISGCDLFSCFH